MMGHFEFSTVARRLLVAICIAIGLLPCLSVAQTDQTPQKPLNSKAAEQPLIDRPFRRIFVPQNELPEIPMDNLRPMEIDKLPSALERLVRRNNASIDPLAETAQGLKSIHAVAQLIGADLLSERTRLTWPQEPSAPGLLGSSMSQRERLSPWNLAIESSYDELNSSAIGQGVRQASPLRPDTDPSTLESNINQAPSWVFDPLGQPSLQRLTNEYWIRWSLKSIADSTPNRLNFEALVPKTVDGCFVVLLPKSARITASNVVSRRLKNWEHAASRLGNWPDQNPMLGTKGAAALDLDYWVLEIGGHDKLVFTIELGANSSREVAIEKPQDWGIDRLFSRHTLQYSSLPNQIRILGEWEWSEVGDAFEPIQLELTPGMKLRSVVINDREPSIEFQSNKIKILAPVPTVPVRGDSANRTKMSAEFLFPKDQLSEDTHGNIRLPTIKTTNGVVLFGSTILQDQIDSRFVEVSCDSGRLESVRKTADGLHRLEYYWNRSVPEIRCSLIGDTGPGQVETMVRIAVESDRCVANIRVRLLELVGQGIQQISLPVGWSLEPNSILVKPQVIAGVVGVDEVESVLRIDANQLTNSESTLDFQLYRDLESGSEFQLDQMPWIHMVDRTLRECVYVEPNANNRLRLKDKLRPWLLSEEDLTPWQRESLPRIGRALLLGTKNQHLPPLIASSLEESLVVPVQTRIRRLNSLWKVEHRFRLSEQWSTMAQMHVHLPADCQWFYESPQRFPLPARFDDENKQWVLEPENLWLDKDSGKLASVVAIQTIQSAHPPLELQAPRVSEAKRHLHQLILSDELLLEDAPLRAVQVSQDQTGTFYEWTQDFTGIWKILDTKATEPKTPYFFHSNLDLFVDGYGDQIAQIQTDVVLRGFHGKELTLICPTGWTATNCTLIHNPSNGTSQAQTLSLIGDSSNAKIVLAPTLLDGALSLRIRLAGPKVIQESPIPLVHKLFPWMNANRLEIQVPSFKFSEGQMQIENSGVWIPKQFQLQGPSNQPGPWWPVWQWSRRAWDYLWLGSFQNQTESAGWIKSQNAHGVSLLNQWKRVEVDPQNLDGKIVHLEKSGFARGVGWIAVFWAMISAGLFRRWPSLLVFLCIASCLGSFWLAVPWSILSQQVFVGLSVGGLIGRLVSILSPSTSNYFSNSHADRSSTWCTMEDPDPLDPTEKLPNLLGSIPKVFLIPWLMVPVGLAAASIGSLAIGYTQDPADGSARVFDILIPISEAGEPAGSTIYVPEELVKWIEQDDRDRRQRESAAMAGSSKHVLRLDSRTFGFGNADQPMTSVYEMWIGETAVGRPVRFPFTSDTQKLNRFSVDGVEVLSGRFSRTDNELVWYPERSGRRTVQIDSQVRLSILDSPPLDVSLDSTSGSNLASSSGLVFGEKNAGKVWAISSEILPVGNAVFELETDGAWSISILACGRLTNPSVGRIWVQLGNKSRIEGYFQPPSSGNRTSASIMPNDPSQTNGEFPTMNTELLLDQEQLMARTVIEFPSSMIISDEVEIESDSQWLPIGSSWGDAKFVEVRTGSTLDRKRYVVRWNRIEEARNKAGDSSSTGPQKRSIVTTWVPTGDPAIRNILFAECRDRRVRQGILRYARSPGSVWTLDGISSWIPAITSKERLDWPELKDPPLSTNLRIPISSGFGVLRRQDLLATEQLWASNRLHLESNRMRLTSTIKVGGTAGKKQPLILELPVGYKIKKAFTVAGSVDFLTWEENSITKLQILSDGQFESNSELVIEAFKELITENGIPLEFQWPELSTTIAWKTPPTFAVSAVGSWLLEFPNSDSATNLVKRGLGENQILHQKSAGVAQAQVIRAVKSDSTWTGTLVLKIPSQTSSRELQLIGLRSPGQSPLASNTWSSLEISMPKEAIASWSSNNPITELSSLGWNERVLAIDPIDSASDLLNLEGRESPIIDFKVNLTAESNWNADAKWHEQIMINGIAPAELVLAIEDSNHAQLYSNAKTPLGLELSSEITEALGITAGTWQVISVPLLQPTIATPVDNTPYEYIVQFGKYSRTMKDSLTVDYWIQRQSETASQGFIQWTFPPGWNCAMIKVNGVVYPFRQLDDRLSLFYPPLEPCAHVQMRFTLDPQATENLISLATTLPESELPSCQSAWVLDPKNINEHHSALRLDYSAWSRTLEMLRMQSLPSSSSTWRYSAQRFASLLKESSNSTHFSGGFLTSKEYSQGIGLLASMPWADSKDYAACIAGASDLSSNRGDPDSVAVLIRQPDPIGTTRDQRAGSYALGKTLAMILVFCGLVVFWHRSQGWLQSRPWWDLLSLALAWWLIAGDLWLPSFLALISAIVVVDSYRMVIGQFRRNAIRVPR